MTNPEDRLRTELLTLADRAGRPGPGTADLVIPRARRQRRARLAVAGAALAAALLLAVPIGVRLADGPDGAAVVAPGTATATTAAPVTTRAPVPGPVPADPEIGVPYAFVLHTHCGIDLAEFSGRFWQASQPAPEPGRLPGPGDTTTYDGSTSGTMTLLSPTVLRFEITDPYAEGRGSTYDFQLLPGVTQPPYLCE